MNVGYNANRYGNYNSFVGALDLKEKHELMQSRRSFNDFEALIPETIQEDDIHKKPKQLKK